MGFDLLHEDIRKALRERGFERETEPQLMAIEPVLSGKHVLLIAPVGSGKTEAVMLPIFHRILTSNPPGIAALYITPLRALNRDMLSRMEFFSDRLKISLQVRHGDTPQSERRKQLRKPPQVLITTPETLQAMLIGSKLRRQLKNVRWVIIDEVHELVGSKRGAQLSVGLERLVEISGEFQRIGLSATVGDPEKVAKFLGGGRDVEIINVPIPKKMRFSVSFPSDGGEIEKLLKCDSKLASQIREICRLIDENRATLIFVNTRQAAEALGARMKIIRQDVGVHHGSLSREARIEAEEDFKRGKLKALICTSSMELGIDIGTVDLVIQYTSPRQVMRFLQRVGRSGHRLEQTSRGTIIAVDEDDVLESCIITQETLKGNVESPSIHEKSLDTLANQICAILVERGEMEIDELLRIIKRAYPFRNLHRNELQRVVEYLRSEGLLSCHDGKIVRRGRTRNYLIENLSMIPDERKFDVFDIVSGKVIGSLDESFVVTSASPGSLFITRGEVWRVEDVGEKVMVSPSTEMGEIPSWAGEEILVPFEIAQEVGRLRGELANALRRSRDEALKILSKFNIQEEAAVRVLEYIENQIRGGYEVPTDDRVVVEIDGRNVVINACFGHKVNETIGRVLSSLLSARFGASVGMDVDPYRIKLQLPVNASSDLIRGTLLSIKPEYVGPIIEKSLRNTSLFRWKLVQVARKFGAISKDVRYIENTEIFSGTPVYEEAMRELMQERLDVERASEIVEKLHAGEIKLTFSSLSPIGAAGLSERRELLLPARAERSILLTLKRRIEGEKMILFCMLCKDYVVKMRVSDIPERPQCPKCRARLIAALKPWEEDEIKVVKRGGKSKEDLSRIKRMHRNASLVLSYGKKAVIALAARGVGPERASRILFDLQDEDELYRRILDAERNYIATRRFWS